MNEQLLLLVETGSRARGLAWTAEDVRRGFAAHESDRDMQGVFAVSPLDFYSLDGVPEFRKSSAYNDNAEDGLVWELTAFFRQLMKGSPEMLEVLFSPNLVVETELGYTLQQAARQLASMKTVDRLLTGSRGLRHGSNKHQVQALVEKDVAASAATMMEAYKQRADAVRRALAAVHMLRSADVFGGGELLVHMGEYCDPLKLVRRGLAPGVVKGYVGADMWEETDAWFAALYAEAETLEARGRLRPQVDPTVANLLLRNVAQAMLAESKRR